MGMKMPRGQAQPIAGATSKPKDAQPYEAVVGANTKPKNIGTEQEIANSATPCVYSTGAPKVR